LWIGSRFYLCLWLARIHWISACCRQESPVGTANLQYFANPDLAQTGSLALSPVSGPWYFNTDLALRKFFDHPSRDNATVELSASFSNLFNHTNFDVDSTPDGVDPDISVYNAQSINATSFGLINKTFAPRKIQFGLRLHFKIIQ
jgi:hypothetical protein